MEKVKQRCHIAEIFKEHFLNYFEREYTNQILSDPGWVPITLVGLGLNEAKDKNQVE